METLFRQDNGEPPPVVLDGLGGQGNHFPVVRVHHHRRQHLVLLPSAPGQNPPQAERWFTTQLQPSSYKADGPAPRPPKGLFDLVRYPSPAGSLAAYLTPDPGDGVRHPALLWAHGGFGGVGSWFWEPTKPENDQTAGAFRKAGIVLMCPSWRGENDNPGEFEMFLGEVDDLLAAGEYLATRPYVDPGRIYLAGHIPRPYARPWRAKPTSTAPRPAPRERRRNLEHLNAKRVSSDAGIR